MEDLLTKAFDTGDIKIIVISLILYLIIYVQRNSTKKIRDEDRDNLDKRITVIERDIEEVKSLDLSAKLAQILTELAWIKEKLKDNT
jgi:hypothetical protein